MFNTRELNMTTKPKQAAPAPGGTTMTKHWSSRLPTNACSDAVAWARKQDSTHMNSDEFRAAMLAEYEATRILLSRIEGADRG